MQNRYFIFISSILFLLGLAKTYAGPREDTEFLIGRILGTKLSSTSSDFNQVLSLIQNGNTQGAADYLTKHRDFYNVQLKSHFAPRTNEESSKLVFLNDYTATLIGMVRDDISYQQVLSGDILYVANPNLGLMPYSHTNNRHYEELDKRKIDLSNPNNLIQRTQSGMNGTQVPKEATAGIITTRQAAAAFFSAGTNRAMFRFVMMNYMCRDVEGIHDVSRPSNRIRKDISRAEPFAKDCIGCHSIMDPLTGAFAKYDFDLKEKRLVYSAQGVQDKNNINDNVFNKGYKTVDDSWVNYMRVGPNSALGWRAPASGVRMNQKFGYTSGFGAKSMGAELARTKAFSACAVKQVFEKVCLKSEAQLDSQDRVKVEEIATNFETNNYNYRSIWVDTALYCLTKR